MSEENTDADFKCGSCEFSTADLREGMGHASATAHELTRPIDDEGTTVTISLALNEEICYDEDDEDGWN